MITIEEFKKNDENMLKSLKVGKKCCSEFMPEILAHVSGESTPSTITSVQPWIDHIGRRSRVETRASDRQRDHRVPPAIGPSSKAVQNTACPGWCVDALQRGHRPRVPAGRPGAARRGLSG